ncbi:fdxN element excision recombinase XisF [Nodosilinea sp. E11]|uniref:fdxN element excision recombinase XisF n=1 Tax=Nodosilinea sp. E11 TaxID=3037479 RepID=UPI00293440D5|nr:fdxN element excision recombinase XisF [Nodosilinea sp. E11]WOD37274.1 fdxN element excision recombinase XisF [Nodosilinea sp. E11]
MNERFSIERLEDVSHGEDSAGYLRLSKMEQAVNTNALKNQKQRVKEAGVSVIITDIQSGRRDDRPGLTELISMVKQGQIKRVTVTRLDRLGRTVPIIRDNIAILQEYKVDLKVIDQNIELNTPEGMFMVNLLASLAEMEIDQVSSRISAVKAYRRNKKIACDVAPFAYTTREGKYQINRSPYLCLLNQRPDNFEDLGQQNTVEDLLGMTVEDIALDCIEIFKQEKGLTPTVRAIAEKYGLGYTVAKLYSNNSVLYWSGSGLKKWLLNPVLRGNTVYNKRKQLANGKRETLPSEDWQVIPNTHPDQRLLSDSEFHEIKEILDFNAVRGGYRLYNRNPFEHDAYSDYAYQRRLVFCDDCGTMCRATSRHSKDGNTIYHYYYCQNRHRGCNNKKGTRRDLIERRLIDDLLKQSQTLNKPDLNGRQSDDTPTAVPYNAKLDRLEEKLAKLDSFDGFDTYIEASKEETRKQIEQEKQPLSKENLPNKTAEEIILAGNNLLLWHTFSHDEKVEIYPRLIDRILVSNGKVNSVKFKKSDSSI